MTFSLLLCVVFVKFHRKARIALHILCNLWHIFFWSGRTVCSRKSQLIGPQFNSWIQMSVMFALHNIHANFCSPNTFTFHLIMWKIASDFFSFFFILSWWIRKLFEASNANSLSLAGFKLFSLIAQEAKRTISQSPQELNNTKIVNSGGKNFVSTLYVFNTTNRLISKLKLRDIHRMLQRNILRSGFHVRDVSNRLARWSLLPCGCLDRNVFPSMFPTFSDPIRRLQLMKTFSAKVCN